MAGYFGYSMSNNAVDAYNNGRMPASVLAKKIRVSTAAVKSILSPCEWHHTSSHYNRTDFYDGSILIPLANNTIPRFSDFYNDDELYDAADLLIEMQNFTKAEKTNSKKVVYENCTVYWLEWGGTRKRPKCTECEESGCRVEFNGKTSFEITLPTGKKFLKRQGTNGFSFFNKKTQINEKAVQLGKIAS
jgi:hypothetical protein